MKKIELLSPAGDFETLKMAINAHADAVYLSGKNYGARKFAKNFSNEELVDAVKYAHLYGVKIYVTINTIIYESEITDFLNYVLFLHEIGVDAVIMQDIGMIKLVREMLPNLEIHASTQCHVHNNEGLELLKSIGVKRAVLARELSIGEIEKLECDIEKEVFIHGALCLSYSGQCYFSKFHGGRSGNRGECAGVCRLPYQLLENNNIVKTEGNYLLSMRDLCTIDLIKDLIKIGVTSLKIEGRMKSPAYVYYVTKVYRTIIDNYYQNKETLIDETTINNLKVLFNREFTKGYLNNEYGSMVMNIKMPNHQGIHLGEVISYNKKKITIKLDDDVYQNDGIRFSNKEGMIINYLY
ncbi:MAG: U32 family peptidase, partial [Tenericutes bacterium]|nr:U32 family peptidase [Mycoplasmatota bacterium]